MRTDIAFRVVIPARYQSTRFPGKPLKLIHGKPMVLHVYERALKSAATQVVIATDDEKIFKVATNAGAQVCMTDPHHETGTDRLVEVATTNGWPAEDVIVNVQGDEPLIPVDCINQVATNLIGNTQAVIATLCTRITDKNEYLDPNVVKVVFNSKGMAMYFSRSPIPHNRDGEFSAAGSSFRHIGIYAYRAGYLANYPSVAASLVEDTEKLEQLRVLDNGDLIHVDIARELPGPGVDTPEQLALVESIISCSRSDQGGE